MANAILLYSGGMDSTTLLYDRIKRYHDQIVAVSFNYGSKHNAQELKAARYHTDALSIPHHIIDLTFIKELFKSALLDPKKEIPHSHYTDESQRQTVVPFRNGIMISVAAGLAESLELDYIYIASHAGDHSVYADCRGEFNDLIRQAIWKGTYGKPTLMAPYEHLNKIGIARLGKQLSIDYSTTYSCYEGNEIPCGQCGACREVYEALIKA